MSGIKYPVDIKHICKFEHQNNISVNVYGCADKKIFTLPITTMTVARHRVNLLYIAADETSHYALVQGFSRLVSRQYNNHKNKTYFCQYCLHGCTSEEVLKNHLGRCRLHGAQRIKLPEADGKKGRGKVSSLQKQNTSYVYLLSSTRISKAFYVNKTRVSHRNPSAPNTSIRYHVVGASN